MEVAPGLPQWEYAPRKTRLSRATPVSNTMRVLTALVFLLASAACGPSVRNIPGTTVPDTGSNRKVIEAVEAYRVAVEKKDAPALALMASRDYWEDGGTPEGNDDYGYEGLKQVLAGRFRSAESVRYSLKYLNIKYSGERAFVEVLIDASYTVEDARGEVLRKDMREQNQLVLEWDGQDWKFLSGL